MGVEAACSVCGQYDVLIHVIAAQEAQKDAVSAFDDFMDECLEKDWAHDRGRLVGQLMPVGASSKHQHSRPSPQGQSSSAPLLLQGPNGRILHAYHLYAVAPGISCLSCGCSLLLHPRLLHAAQLHASCDMTLQNVQHPLKHFERKSR